MRVLPDEGLVPAAMMINGRAETGRFDPSFPAEAPSADHVGPKLQTITLSDFVALPLPPRQHVLAPILPERGLAMLFAPRGVGKTQVAVNIGWAVACGQPFFRWYAPRPRRVLYVDGEMPQEMLQERAQAMVAASACLPPEPDFFRLLSMDRQELGTSLNLALPQSQIAVERELDGIDLLILDNISTLVSSGRENDAESWNEMQAWLLKLRRQGKTVLLIHHAGRGENARGTSKREDVLDTVIQLKHPEDYDVEEGARFEVHLTKARGVHGDNALPFEAKLEAINGRPSLDLQRSAGQDPGSDRGAVPCRWDSPRTSPRSWPQQV